MISLCGEEHASHLCAVYEADPEPYRCGTKKMKFDERIYQSAKPRWRSAIWQVLLL